ncbi:hypothetical protein MBLNU230_g0984t1 [Neophaeotheca triangularis]
MYPSHLLPLLPALTTALTLSYDTGYDDPNRPLTSIACSDGPNGLTTRYNWQLQASIPNFPYIGGSEEIAGWNSENCGQCYEVQYGGRRIYVLGVDRAAAGLNVGRVAMDALTGGQAGFLGRVEVGVERVGFENCGGVGA